MPTYEYECLDCHAHFEEFQSISAPPADTCPECGSHNVHRLISGGVGLIFKGSGFYITDYAHKKTSGGNGHNGSAKGKTDQEKKSEKTEKKASSSSETK